MRPRERHNTTQPPRSGRANDDGISRSTPVRACPRGLMASWTGEGVRRRDATIATPRHKPAACPVLAEGRSPGSRAKVDHLPDPRLPELAFSGKVRNVLLAYRCGGSSGMAIHSHDAEWVSVTGFPFQSPLALSDHLGRLHHRRSLQAAHAVTLHPRCTRHA